MKEISISSVFASAADVYKSRFWFYVGATLFASLLAILGGVLFAFVLGMVFAIGYLLTTAQSSFYLRACRGEKVELLCLFDTAKNPKIIKRVLCARGWADLWILIWALIPVAGIVFAVIRYYEYCFVPYLVSDKADISATKLKEESKRITKGYKGQLFLVDFLFFIAIVLGFTVLSLLGLIPYVGYVFKVLSLIFLIAVAVFASPFLSFVHAQLYIALTQDVKPVAGENKSDNVYLEEEEEAKLDSVLPTA